FLRPHIPEDIRYFQGLLNSRLLTFRFRGLAKLTSPGMWEAFDNSIGDLPIRRIDFDDEDSKNRHDDVVALTISLEQAIAAAQTGLSTADRSIGARKAEALKDNLDDLVFDIYGL